ncbi:hypothetical protein B0H14DRAFT_2624171 [Mycena olivaceomarginata]|nr:hypothetical protein B0H14DRAFT_2624171 [Mycena olivaceomarginata]
MAAPKPAPKPHKPLSYDDMLHRQIIGSIYSGCYYRKYAFFLGIPVCTQNTYFRNREQRNTQMGERMARLHAQDHTVLPEVLQARLDARRQAARKYREKNRRLLASKARKTRKQARKLKDDQRAKYMQWWKCTRWWTAVRHPPRNRLPSATTMTDVTTPDARKPDKPRDLSEALSELHAEKPQPISRPYPYVLQLADITEEDRAEHWEMMWACRRRQRHNEATRKAVAAAARKPVDYSLLPPRRCPIRLVKCRKSQATTSNDQSENPVAISVPQHPLEATKALEMATQLDNANKTDGLPALTEAEDDNEIPELTPVIEHDSGTYIPSASYGYGPDPRKPASEAYVDMAALAKHAHLFFTMDESGATPSQKAPTAHIPCTRQSAAMSSSIHAELPPPSSQPTRGLTPRRLSLTADEYAQSWLPVLVLKDAIKLRQAIFDEATGALGTDDFVAAATGVEELWLSQWDLEASWGGSSTWDTPPAVDGG